MADVLKEELLFYEEQKPELLKTHPGQWVLVKGRGLIGVFPTRDEAYAEGVRRFSREAFLIKQILDKDTIEHVPLLALTIERAGL
ncbi:MAG TPA: DUF5678 domain-containing protein [Methylomirabilota bacterium]|nr:DUF5678 domain-containing protein [Methylomirabilota bacterium]